FCFYQTELSKLACSISCRRCSGVNFLRWRMYQMLSQTMRAAKTVKRITAKRTAHGIFMIFAPRRARLYRGMVSKQRELSCTDRACEFLLRRTGAAVML